MKTTLVSAVVAVVALTGCGTRTATPIAAATVEPTTTITAASPTTTEASSTTTSTTAPSPRSTSGIQAGQMDAILACEPELRGAVLDVVAVNGPYAAAVLHRGGTVSRRTLTLIQGRWHDSKPGSTGCEHRVDESFGAYPPTPTWGQGEYSVYFEQTPVRQGSFTDGTLGSDGVDLVVGISGNKVTKGSIGGGYWMVLTIDAPEPGVHCGYNAAGRLLHEAAPAARGQATGPGGSTNTGPPTPPPTPTSCPATAPPVP